MRQSQLTALTVIAAVILVGAFSAPMVALSRRDATASWTVAVPGMDGQPANRKASVSRVVFGAWHRVFGPGAEARRLEGVWPGFRGPGRDNRIALDGISSVDSLDRARLLWQRDLGEGHAAPAVMGDRLYVVDYDEGARRELVRAFRLSDGEELWQTGYACPLKRNHGFTRAIPAVTAETVVTMGADGHVMALDPRDGSVRWGVDLVNDWKAEIPSWYASQCPLVDAGVVVIAPASSAALMVGFDELTGKELWRTPNETGWKLSHSSVMKARLGGVDQYLYAAVGGIVGISAAGPDRGALLWSHAFSANVVAPSPLAFGDRVVQCAGYGAGSVCVEVTRSGDSWRVAEIARYAPSAGLASEQQTPVIAPDGTLVSIQPKDSGASRGALVGAGPSGEILWSSGADLRFGLGPYALAGDRLFALNDDGELFLIRVARGGFELLDRKRLIEGGRDAWGPLALTSSGLLLARDSTRLVCYELLGEER